MCRVEKIIEPLPIRNGAKPIYYYTNDSGCFICISHRKDRDGYFKVDRNGKEWSMHRYIYNIFKGEIPKGYDICHLCDNPNCNNPDHLEAKTHMENMQDKIVRNRPIKEGHRLTKTDICEIAKSELTIPQLALSYDVSHSTIVKVKAKNRINNISKRAGDKPSIKQSHKTLTQKDVCTNVKK